MQRSSVLIVDDDKEMRLSLEALLQAAGWDTHALSRAAEVDKHLADHQVDVILSDVRMPGMSGLELLDSLQGKTAPPLVLISAHGDISMAVEAMNAGAYSFVEKPYEPRRLLSILSHAADQFQMRSANERLRARLSELSGLDRILLGNSPKMIAFKEQILDFADSPASVLISGETGTGKDLVARALHDLSERSDAQFTRVKCGSLTPDLLRDIERSISADATLFLDEVCDCPLDVQAMLVGVVGEKTGAMRVISATNEDVEKALSQGHLRKDLFFRLNTIHIELPPLRDRHDDITLLARFFLEQAARLYEIDPPELTPEDISTLLSHDWAGNIRELRGVAERRVLQARRGAGSMASALANEEASEEIPATLREAVAAFEREMIGKALRAHEGRMDAVADALGIGRRTLNEKIVKLGLNKDAYV